MKSEKQQTDGVGLFRLLSLLSLLSCLSCQRTSTTSVSVQSPTIKVETTSEPQIVAFCGGCHAMPQPASFPKEAWYDEVKRGFEFYHQFKPANLTPPPVSAVVDYFQSRAPEALIIQPSESLPGPTEITFRTAPVLSGYQLGAKPAATSFVRSWSAPGGVPSQILWSDMANGGVQLSPLMGPPRQIIELKHPAAASRCDLNDNGKPDVVVAELGSFNPADHELGRVIWVADIDDARTKAAVALIEGIGRVADVQPADFDGDGDTDLVVAEFGWHKTGRILHLRNNGTKSSPHFDLEVIDARPGTIHVRIADLNNDGHPDFVALISQEFEVVEAFVNHGDGTFERKAVDAAQDPAFGSSGIQLVDLDADGDLDVIATNGDMFDSFLIKPYHGIRWLENKGTYPFVAHQLSFFPGAHRALAGDLDGDGDLDIVATAFLPASTRATSEGKKLDSVIWLERNGEGEFVRHTLESGNCIHPTLDLADFDSDGDLDLVVGEFRDNGGADQSAATLWWNNRLKQEGQR